MCVRESLSLSLLSVRVIPRVRVRSNQVMVLRGEKRGGEEMFYSFFIFRISILTPKSNNNRQNSKRKFAAIQCSPIPDVICR